MKSLTTNVESSNVKIPSHEEEVFHESSESFQEESSSSSLNDDVQQSSEEVILPQTNTQSISNNMVPNVDEANSVLNGILKEEVYVGLPPCFVSKQYPDHVYALDKALYGLKQASRAWYDVLSQFLIDSGFQKVPTPMVEQARLKLDLVGKPVDHTDYRSMIGSLMYVSSSRPDITFATYADHARCHFDRKTESEYVAVSSCCAQVLWMRTQLTDYGFFCDKVTIYCDSKNAISISCNPVQHTRTKHIDVRSNEDIRLEMAKLIKKNRILLNNNIFPHEEASMKVLLAKERILKLIQAWDKKQIELWGFPELLPKLLNDSRTIDEMLKQREQAANLAVQENIMKAIQTFLQKFSRYPFGVMPKVLLIAWERFAEIKHAFTDKQYQPEEIQELMCKLLEDIQVAQKKVKIAFENADSSSRVELIPSKIKYANKVVLNFHKEFSVFSSFKEKEMTDYFRIMCSRIRKKSSSKIPNKNSS
uniref:Reverse transcriptase Ty1/copia-type domain-containing protein n=1 Tax=Tanacetum cinerariifolium TaxID=118510 RepID=A0A6L2JMQ6_TANCI|nr:hypothetical protein [Tanacetum cinerariifolium]